MSFSPYRVWIIGGTGALGSSLAALIRTVHPLSPEILLLGRTPLTSPFVFQVKGAPQILPESSTFSFDQNSLERILDSHSIPPPDLCIVTVKSTQLSQVIEIFQKALLNLPLSLREKWGQTPVLLASNGLGVYQKWVSAFPHWKPSVSRATCWFGARWLTPRTSDTPGVLGVSGPAPIEWAGASAKPLWVSTWEKTPQLSSSGFRYLGPAPFHCEEVEWRKAIWNGSMNPVFALAQVTNGDGADRPDLMSRIEKLVIELLNVAKAEGFHTLGSSQEWLEKIYRSAKNTGKNLNSMAVDLSLGRTTEIDFLNGEVARRGLRAGVPTPECDQIISEIFGVSQKTLLHS